MPAPHEPIPILLYHAVTDHPGAELARWSVTPETFRQHLDCLGEARRTPLTVSAFLAAVTGHSLPDRPVVVSFDDGYGDFVQAAEEMAARGVPSTLYVTTGVLDGSAGVLVPPAPMLRSEQLAPLEALGVEIGAHSHHHHHLDVAPRSVVRDEIWRPKAILEDLLGHAVPSFAYPHGGYQSAVREQVQEAGYASACAVRNAFSSCVDNPFSLARLTVLDSTTTDTLRAWLEGTGARVAPQRELLRTRVWRMGRRGNARARRRSGRA